MCGCQSTLSQSLCDGSVERTHAHAHPDRQTHTHTHARTWSGLVVTVEAFVVQEQLHVIERKILPARAAHNVVLIDCNIRKALLNLLHTVAPTGWSGLA